jgi:hypothetical protein
MLSSVSCGFENSCRAFRNVASFCRTVKRSLRVIRSSQNLCRVMESLPALALMQIWLPPWSRQGTALRAGEVHAYLAVSDPTASNQAQLIIDTARDKKLPTMFDHLSHVARGGLGSYAVSFHEMGRLSAKYVQRILTGVKPQDLPVEGIDKIELAINLKTAKQIGLTVPPNVLGSAAKVIK